MSSDSEKAQNTAEQEQGKRHATIIESTEKKMRQGEEQQMRYYAGHSPRQPHPMMYRHGMDPMMMRPPMPRPISPRITHMEDSDLTDAMIFLNRIKDEYSDNLQIYDNFLETMRDFRFEKIDAEEVCKAVRILFKDKQHLIRLFDEYLPNHLRINEPGKTYEIPPLPQQSQQTQQERMSNAQYRGQGFVQRPGGPMHMGQGMPMHMARIPHPMGPMPHPSFIQRQGPPSMRKSPPVPLNMHQEPVPVMKPGLPKPSSASLEFVHDVKKRYQNRPLIYRQFLDVLQNPKSSFEKLRTQVSALLADSPDLIRKFEKVFNVVHNPPGMPGYSRDADPLRRIKQKLAKEGSLGHFLKIINAYNQNYLTATEVVSMVEPLIEDEESMKSLKSFIKYSLGMKIEDEKEVEMEKFGSYKILPECIEPNPSATLSNDVLNYYCICVPTHESEEDTYVFRHKNSSEEMLVQVIDERSEADLEMDRLKFLIIKLEELYERVGNRELDLEDIEIPSALVKETLRCVYWEKNPEVLETLLINPKKSLPVILRRLNRVFKENLEKLRGFKKFWRDIVEEHYYRAYDTKGMYYRSQEKNYLSLRHVMEASATPHEFKIIDATIFTTIRNLFNIFATSLPANGSKKQNVEQQLEVLDGAIGDLCSIGIAKTINFDMYALLLYLSTLYSRFYEVKSYAHTLSPITANPVAVSISLQEDINIYDRYHEILAAAESLMRKDIDVDRFEEMVRRMTDSCGFRLYNLKKIMSKIEKQTNILIENEAVQYETAEQSEFAVEKTGDVIKLIRISPLPQPVVNESADEAIENKS